MLCSAKGAGNWVGLCMDTSGSERVRNVTAVPMTVVQVYNRCIGTMAESPKKGMRMDDTRIQETTEMCPPHKDTMVDFTTCLAANSFDPLRITERGPRGIRSLKAEGRTTSGGHHHTRNTPSGSNA